LVREHLANVGARVLLFGSRARGDAAPRSDIDVAVLPEAPLPAGLLAGLREALEESQILRQVDLVDLTQADEAFRARVLLEGVEWTAWTG
jgi:predicted nucleotidyltransferase